MESSDASAKELCAIGKQRLTQGWRSLLIVKGNMCKNNLDFEKLLMMCVNFITIVILVPEKN